MSKTAHECLNPLVAYANPMGRSTSRSPAPKKRINASPSGELLEWVLERTGPGKEFSTITHAVERGWTVLREIEEGKWVRAKAK